jgi:hypothetical protein
MRRTALAASSALAALALAGNALASWQPGGGGSGYAKTRTMPAGNTPSASVSNRKVTVSWSASALPGGGSVDGYLVKRYATGGSAQAIGAECSGTITALSCTEGAVPPGSWRYTVTPVLANWQGSESAMSSAVTVASPALTLDSSTVSCLPATVTGQITSFIDGQTVTFRLDNPSTGTVLSGSITPSTVPSNGTASVSVTIPAGTSSGAHAIYAIGDRNASQVAVVRTSTMSGNATKELSGATALSSNRVQALQSDGFQVGTSSTVNASGTTYYWTALKAAAGHLTLGTYTGTGANRSITGLGYSPEYVMILSASANNAVQRMSAMTRTFRFDAHTGTTTGITSLTSDGFSLGTSSQVNASGTTYHDAAFNQCSGEMSTSSYTGNGSSSRSVTGVGFQPDYLVVHADDTVTAREGVHRPSAVSGSSSLYFSALSNTSTGITGLQSDGFSVGSNSAANASGVTYDYVAFKDRP